MPHYSYRKREFLASISTGSTAFIRVEAESSDDGTNGLGNYILTLADCRRIIELEFPLTTARARQQSLAKADLLARIINEFCKALREEARLIDKYQRGVLVKG